MDFALSPDEQAFAAEVRRWLADHPPGRFPIDGMDAGYGSGAHSHAFMRALGAQGWIALTWPREYGGAARPIGEKLVLFEELARAGAPFGPLAGCDQTGETIIRYGSPRLREALLPRIARGEVTFWQGFSEPNAGSDLLALRTEATREGDEWVIRGHKIWSSHAGIATHGLVLARTARGGRRQDGLSMFIVDNRTPGMDIRPIRSLTGEVYHYEVFIDGARVPPEDLLGREHGGFAQLLAGLDTDRFWGRFYKAPMLLRVLRRLVDYANTTTRGGVLLARDPGVRRRLAAMAAELEVLRVLFWRIGWLMASGQPTPYESALAKVMADEAGQKLAALGMELLGPWSTLAPASPSSPLHGEIQHLYLTTMGHTIAGGTSEVLRTTVATRGLGLPREPRTGGAAAG